MLNKRDSKSFFMLFKLFILFTFCVLQTKTCSHLSIQNELKFDCIPQGKSDQIICEERNCSWTPDQNFSPYPWCYYSECYNNYNTINVTQTSKGIVAFFNLTTGSHYKNNIQLIRLDVIFETSQRLRVTVSYSES